MSAYPNNAKEVLSQGKIALGFGVSQSRTVEIAQIAKTCGFHWLFIDMEHAPLNVETAAQMAAAALPVGIAPIVRVPGKGAHHASRLLDAGAQGIVVPHVDTVEQAERAVAHCKYPPIGERSAMGTHPLMRFETVPVGETMRQVNDVTLVVVMLETPQAIANADAIAAVKGVDVILIGTNDLCATMGIPGEFEHPDVVKAYESVLAACRKHRKFPGMGGVYEPRIMEKYIRMGMRFILSGSDASFVIAGARARAKVLNEIAL
ncbi:MAG: HpcH/HpaI aldolase family protein [Burkholderiales bacterium]